MPLALIALSLIGLANPRVAVKARAYVDALKARSDGRTVQVRGILRDNLGQPLAQQPIVVIAGTARQAGRTDASGHFDVPIRVDSDGERTIEVQYAGNPLVAPARQTQRVQVGRGATAVRIQIPPTIEAEQPLTITASLVDAENQPIPNLPLQVRIDATPREPARVGPDGQAPIPLPPLAAGAHTVRVYFAGNDDHLPADDEIGFEAARSMGISLTVADANPLPDQPLVFFGRVDGPDEVSVRLLVDGAPLKTVTARNGGWRLVVDPDVIGAGSHRVRAAATTSVSGWRDGLSDPVTVEVPEPPPPSPWWIWAPAILAAISFLGVLGRAWRRRPRPKANAPAPPPQPAPAFVFEPAKRGQAGSLQVVLRDGLTGRPLQGTLVLLPTGSAAPARSAIDPPSGEQVMTDAHGQATLETTGDRLWAWAEGYAPASHQLPGGGGFAAVNLLPIRARLQTVYAEVLAAAGRPVLAFGKQTPREAAPPLANRGAPDDPLAALTALVERCCFGATEPDHADLQRADELALAVEAGLGRRA
jgi:hypothetical protein